MRLIALLLLTACTVGYLQAQTEDCPYTVGPGYNGLKTFITDAKEDDVINVSFSPASGYELVSANCDDPQGLGWSRTGKFSFRLTVRGDLVVNTFHVTHFEGELRKVEETEETEGDGGESTEDLIPWDMDGQFKVFGEHEGVDNDHGRSPKAEMVSSKPAPGPVSVGQATLNEEPRQFVGDGNFTADGRVFLGWYTPVDISLDNGTQVPLQLGDAEQKDCPEGDGVTVTYVYFGCTDSGGIGGMADPDRIEINGFSPADNLFALQSALNEAEEAYGAALAIEEAAMTAYNEATALADEKQAAYEVLLNADAGVSEARERLGAAEQRLRDAQNNPDLAEAREALQQAQGQRDGWFALRDQKEASGLLEHWQQVLDSMDQNIVGHQEDIERYEDRIEQEERAVARADAALQRAIARAERNSEEIAAAKAEAEAAALAVAPLEQVYQEAQAATEQAEALRDAAQQALDDAIANASEAQLAWLDVYAGTLAHELGHRRICYFYADQMTEMLNSLRAWGYALSEARAAGLGRKHFREVWQQEALAIRADGRAMQESYDSPEGTDHGAHPENWDWNALQ